MSSKRPIVNPQVQSVQTIAQDKLQSENDPKIQLPSLDDPVKRPRSFSRFSPRAPSIRHARASLSLRHMLNALSACILTRFEQFGKILYAPLGEISIASSRVAQLLILMRVPRVY